MPVRLEGADGGVAVVVFDLPGSKVNKITRDVLEALDQVLGRLEASPPELGVVFTTGKDHFCVGADVALIAALSSRQEALEGSRRGQEIFARLAGLPCATVAAVRGTCLGGGMEWALACDRIVAAEDARLALPEVRLGILPAWGGSQRLPRRVGLGPAVEIMATGRTLDAGKARSRGMVDAVVPPERLRHEAADLVRRLAADHPGGRVPPARRAGLVGWAARWLPPARSLIFSRVRAEVIKRSGGHYPAPPAIVECVRAALAGDAGAGFARERELFADLVLGEVSRELVGLFLLSQQAKGWYARETAAAAEAAPGGAAPRVAVLGAGIMGAGIAHLAASQGLTVVLRDIARAPLEKGMDHIRGEVRRKVDRGKLTAAEGEAVVARVRPSEDLEAIRDADIVIEAVVEEMGLKRRVLAEAAAAAPGAVFASNTSALSLAGMASALPEAGRLAGLHFFNPVERMPLVEVVVPPGASPATVGTLLALARRLGKVPVRVADAPGFLVNRVLSIYLGEALSLVEEGAGIAAVDAHMRRFGMPMGPLELLDQIGLDVAAKVTETLGAAFGDRMPATTVVPRMLAAGRTGKKGGLGFYRHGQGKPVPDAEGLATFLGSPPDPRPAPATDRLVYPMIAEAARCLEERVVASAEEVDLAMVMGIGWPPFRGGLLRWADAEGLTSVVAALERLAREVGPRFAPPGSLRQRAERGEPFRPHSLPAGDGVD